MIGVATREAYQAVKLIEDGIGVELLLDPDDSIRGALDADTHFSPWRVLHPKGAVAYAKAFRQSRRFDPLWAEIAVRPGVVILDANLDVAWSRMGQFIGDYPTADEVMAAARSAL